MASFAGASRSGQWAGGARGALQVAAFGAVSPVRRGATALRGAWEAGRISGFRTSTDLRNRPPPP